MMKSMTGSDSKYEIFTSPSSDAMWVLNYLTSEITMIPSPDPEINTPNKNPDPTRFVQRVSTDAAFIAPIFHQAVYYARALNYNPRHVLIATYKSYLAKLAGIMPDEDFIVHVCGSWLDDDASEDEKDDLAEVLTYLRHRGFEIGKVNRLGESKP